MPVLESGSIRTRSFGRTMRRLGAACLIPLWMAACSGGAGGESNGPPGPTPPAPNPGEIALSTGDFVPSVLTANTLGPDGGTFQVTTPSDPLAGTRIVVAAGAVETPVQIQLSSAPVTGASGLPEGTAVRSRAIRIEMIGANGSVVGDLRQLASITLPFEPTTDTVNFYKVTGTKLESVGFDAATDNTVTFRSRAPGAPEPGPAVQSGTREQAQTLASSALFATYVGIGLAQTTWTSLTGNARSIGTGFAPSANGWYIPNYGSYYRHSRGGNCFGMVGFAKFYWQQQYSQPLADNYRDAAKTATWVDDEVAIELASRVHNSMIDIWNRYTSEEIDNQTSASRVARSIVGALYVTGAPAMVYLQQAVGNSGTGAHAISVYQADLAADGSAVLHVYDPNFPRDNTRQLNWSPNGGFSNYLSGATAAESSFTYNYFRHVGYYVGLTPGQLTSAKTEADTRFPSSVFPRVTVTSIKGASNQEDVLANTSTTATGQTAFRTTDTSVIVEGTVLGGHAQVAGQVVNNLRIVAPDGNFDAPIDNTAGGGTGKFRATVPLKAGINQVALLAADPNSFDNWAAFKEVLLESSAAPSSFTVTLNWNRDQSDVDLYVREPNGVPGTVSEGKKGDLVYYAHRHGASASSPYLDFDNTTGFGPEHYIARQGMVGLYSDGSPAAGINGTYRIGVHYYQWHGQEAASPAVNWTVNWRLLSACNAPCTDPETQGLWVTGTQSGSLSAFDPGADGESGFNGAAASWSAKWDIAYPTPRLSWTVPPSHTVMLP